MGLVRVEVPVSGTPGAHYVQLWRQGEANYSKYLNYIVDTEPGIKNQE